MSCPVAVVAILVPAVAAAALAAGLAAAQANATDAQLEAASAGTVMRIGRAGGGGRVQNLPLEVYVARVLAGEGEPRASAAAHQALAVAIRTYALANAGRHGRDGFDLCDSTHCQVPRASTPVTRHAALATAGQILTYNGTPAELFYSASCGGHSERAGEVWPGIDFPYLRTAPDDVHESDVVWTLDLPRPEIERALERAGFQGRLRGIRVGERNASGRVARLQLAGLVPDVIAGDQFRGLVGMTALRSTAFSVEEQGAGFRFTGRGYGHGVGMCVIGAGRRAARGEGVQAILAQYYPGLILTGPRRVPAPATPRAAAAPAAAAPVATRAARGIVAQVPASSAVSALEVERLTAEAHEDLARALGVSVAPITVRLHDSIESFRVATGRPWWVSSVSEGTAIDLVPAALLAQRDGLDTTLRIAVAEMLVAQALRERPLWIRTGAARYFGRERAPGAVEAGASPRCPSDAELTLAISAAAQREAEARAEACFAREYGRTRNWRAVR